MHAHDAAGMQELHTEVPDLRTNGCRSPQSDLCGVSQCYIRRFRGRMIDGVRFVDRDHKIEALPSRGAEPAFRYGLRILVRTAWMLQDSRSSITSELNLDSRSMMTKRW